MNPVVKSNLPEIRALMSRFGVTRAFLFGSAATGEMTEESDVDFLVTFDSALDYTAYGDNYFQLMYALQDLLKRDVDIVAEKTISNPYLLQKINSQKIAVL
jgi:predicted nucleotidyltransferase